MGLGRGENWEREKLAITSVFSPFPQICSLFPVPIIRKNQAGFYELLLCGSFLGPPLLDLHLQPLVSWYLARFICTVHLAKIMRVASLLHLWLASFPVGINHLHLHQTQNEMWFVLKRVGNAVTWSGRWTFLKEKHTNERQEAKSGIVKEWVQ